MAAVDVVQSVDGELVAMPDHTVGFLEGWLGVRLKVQKETVGLCYIIQLVQHQV
jgi:hypothetical protein